MAHTSIFAEISGKQLDADLSNFHQNNLLYLITSKKGFKKIVGHFNLHNSSWVGCMWIFTRVTFIHTSNFLVPLGLNL